MVITSTGTGFHHFQPRTRSAAGVVAGNTADAPPISLSPPRRCPSLLATAQSSPLPGDTPVMNAASMTGTLQPQFAGGIVGQQTTASAPSFTMSSGARTHAFAVER